MEIGETEPHYLLIVDRIGTLDVLEIQVEVSDEFFSDEVKLEELERKIKNAIESTLGLTARLD